MKRYAMLLSVVVLMSGGFAIAAAGPASHASLVAGMHSNLAPDAAPDVHYNLYLPPAYDARPDALFPVVINHNPSGHTRLAPYARWADAHDAVLLGIDGISNGKEQGKKNAIADAVLKDLVARGVRAHPTLRFTIGMSGGSADGMRLVRRKPEAYAGCVFMGAGGIIENDKAKHLAYAILGGAKDEWMPGDACYAMADKAKPLGCAVHVELEIDRQHKEAPIERQYAALTWMLELQKLQLPSLPQAQRDANLAAARKRMASAPGIASASDRRTEAELLLGLEPLKPFDERKAALDAWASAMTDLSVELKQPVARHEFLMTQVLASPLAAELSAPQRASFEDAAKGLRATPAVAADWSLDERYRAAESAELHAGLKPDKLTEVLPLWEALAKDAAGTDYETKVARRIRIVKQFIETPSTLQSPTKLKE